jgi:hypothetical protein
VIASIVRSCFILVGCVLVVSVDLSLGCSAGQISSAERVEKWGRLQTGLLAFLQSGSDPPEV